MKVQAVAVDGEHHIIFLRDLSGRRALPIMVGPNEARAIALELSGVEVQRPLTHDLMRNVLHELGVEVRYIAVTELRDRTYYALIMLDRGGVVQEIDARPSDAIALALRCHAPIYVSDEVMEDAGAALVDEALRIVEGEDAEKQVEVDEKFKDIIADAGLSEPD